jgi:hypothetical protein
MPVVSPKRIVIPVTGLIALGCLLLAVVRPEPGEGEFVVIGLIFGTLFGHTTLAAAWCALGPLPLVWRLPLSLLWLAALVASFVAQNPPGPTEMFVVLAAAMLGQWLIVQAGLWVLAIAYGWRLRFQAGPDSSAPPQRERQFGIRQLMIVTAIVGVLLGTGRIILTNLPAEWNVPGRDVAVIVFLGVAAILVTLPLVVAALLPKRSVPACVVVLIVIGVATIWEFPLLARVDPSAPAEVGYLLCWINAFTAAWILSFTLSVRLCGYSPARATEPSKTSES